MFCHLKQVGNAAAHEDRGTPGDALLALKMARSAAVWFHQTYGGSPGFKAGPFVPPTPPPDPTKALQAELDELRKAVAASSDADAKARMLAQEVEDQRPDRVPYRPRALHRPRLLHRRHVRAEVDATMRDKVIPLLQEYFFEDWGRVAAVLGERPGKGGAFLDCRKLRDPTGQEGEERESWSVRSDFAEGAYSQLIGQPAVAAAPEEPAG